MSRKKTEINPIRAERVKILIDREGITQLELSERIFQTQQNISRIINLKQPLTEETAQDIVKAFPEYRIQWLLGYDDNMTIIQKISNGLKAMHDKNQLIDNGFLALANASGFTVESGGTITRDGKSVSFSPEKLDAFKNELCGYLEFRLLRMMK